MHSNQLKLAGPDFRNFLCKMYNKMLSNSHIPLYMLKGEIRTILKSGKTLKTDSVITGLLWTLRMLLEYLVLPSLNRNLSISSRQFIFRYNTNRQTTILTVEEMIYFYTRKTLMFIASLLILPKHFIKWISMCWYLSCKIRRFHVW